MNKQKFLTEDLPYIGSFIVGVFAAIALAALGLGLYKGFNEPFSYYAFGGVVVLIVIIEWLVSEVGPQWPQKVFFKQLAVNLVFSAIIAPLVLLLLRWTLPLEDYAFLPGFLPLAYFLAGALFAAFLGRAVHIGKEKFII